MIISSNIKNYRKKCGLTQKELSEKMNISRQSISKWETGEAVPSIDNLVMLSDLMDLPLDQLVKGKNYLPKPFYFGKPKNKGPLLAWLFLPLLLFFGAIFSKEVTLLFASLFIMQLFYSLGFYDFNKYYNYWILTHTGIKVFDGHILFPFCPLGSILKGAFHCRKEKEISFQEMDWGKIIIDTKGFKGFNTSVSYRPRQVYYLREKFLFVLTLKNEDKVYLNLDAAFFSDSKERVLF